MNTKVRYTLSALALVGLVAPLACGQGGGDTNAARQGFTETPPASSGDASTGNDGGSSTGTTDAGATDVTSPQLAVCSDGQVAAIMHASSMGEIDTAKAVRDRLTDASAKAFAQRMIDDHTALDSALRAVLSAQGITMVESGVSDELTQSAQLTISELSSKSGSELDKAYMDHEVVDHLMDLGVDDHLLGPSIRNPALAQASKQERAAVVQHAQLAVQIQGSLEGQCGGTKSGGGGSSSDAGSSGDSGASDAGSSDASPM